MSDIPYMACPLCGKNFHQSFECDHDEYDLAERIADLQAEVARLTREHGLMLKHMATEQARAEAAEALCATQRATLDEFEDKLNLQDALLREVARLRRYVIESANNGTVCAHADEGGEWISADELEALLKGDT